MNFILSCIYLIVSGAVIFSMAVLILRGEKNISNKIYQCCHICAAIWCTSQILIALSDNLLTLTIAYNYGNLGICFAAAFWILFSASYGKNEDKIKKVYFLPLVLSCVNYILILTNNLHHLYYTSFSTSLISHGIAFYFNAIEIYAYIIIGAFVLSKRIKEVRKSDPSITRKYGGVLIIAAVITPLILSLLYLTGLIKTSFDITPLGFAISVILVRIATARYQFFDMKKELDIASEKLILEKERNRIAQRVHDTTGHTLTMLQSYMKLTEVAIKNDNKTEAYEYISEARTLTSSGIKELRESINQLRSGENTQLITRGILQLANGVKEIPCEVTIQGEDSEKYSYLSLIVYDTVRECITNTLKYAAADKIDIVVKFKEHFIEIIIADDGKGCDNILCNNGLSGIKERILSVGGKVKFISSSGEGFMTRISIPS